MNKVLSQSRVTEVNTLLSRISDMYKEVNLGEDSHLSGMIKSLDSCYVEFTKAINQMNAESKLGDSDSNIEHAVRSFFHLIEGYTWHPDSNVNESAQLVSKILDNYGLKMIHESYATQTSLVDSLLSDMGKKEIKGALKNLSGCDVVVKMLAKAQSEFKQEYIDYEKQKAEANKLESATTIKRKALDIINNKLLVYLQAMVQVNEKDYLPFATSVEQIIKENNSTVRQRKTKSKAE